MYKTKLLLILLIIATCLFVAGIIMPMLTLSKFVIVSNSFSVISGVIELLRSGHYLLFLVVSIFSIVFPVGKILLLMFLLSPLQTTSTRTLNLLNFIHEYGRWSMLDVMVVAILVVTVKLGAIASIEIHIGLYLFGIATLLIMLITHQVTALLRTG